MPEVTTEFNEMATAYHIQYPPPVRRQLRRIVEAARRLASACEAYTDAHPLGCPCRHCQLESWYKQVQATGFIAGMTAQVIDGEVADDLPRKPR